LVRTGGGHNTSISRKKSNYDERGGAMIKSWSIHQGNKEKGGTHLRKKKQKEKGVPGGERAGARGGRNFRGTS